MKIKTIWVKLINHKMLSIKNENIFGFIFLVLFIVFAVWKITSSQKEAKKLYNKLQSQYDQLTIETSIENDVKNTYYHPEWRGAEFSQYITLYDGRKLNLRIDDCISHREIYLDDLIKPGVRLIKKNGSDTLEIIDGKDNYLFKLKIDK